MMGGQNTLTIILCVFFLLTPVNAQSSLDIDVPPGDVVSSFRGSLGIVIGVMSVMLVLAFCALLYAKLCRTASTAPQANPRNHHRGITGRSESGLSGIDKTVRESLPFFRFSSLKGSREGLDCAVCLSRFEETDILRFMPKCKHAFHVDCVDQWLERHSSCPLCRHKVNAEDVSIFGYSDSMRLLRNHSEEDPNIELFVQREEDSHGSSLRFNIGSSFRRTKEVPSKDQEAIDDNGDQEALLHESNRKIIASDVFKQRWSNVSSSDLMILNSEIVDDSENNSSVCIPVLPATSSSSSDHSRAKRSMSDITSISRSRAKIITRSSSLLDNNVEESKVRKLWLPIARNTAQWFADREEKPQPYNHSTQSLTFVV